MITIIKKVNEWFMQYHERSVKRNLAKRITLLRAEAEDIVQVREFNGKLFVCYRDIPIIEQAALGCSIQSAVINAREAYVLYFMFHDK